MNNSSAFKQLSDWMKTDLRPEHFETELKALIKREKQQLLKEVVGMLPEKKVARLAGAGHQLTKNLEWNKAIDDITRAIGLDGLANAGSTVRTDDNINNNATGVEEK